LEAKSANKVYKIGGGLTSKVMSSIASSLSKHNTTPTEPGNSGAKNICTKAAINRIITNGSLKLSRKSL
ncbi:hypothetical protein ACTPD5_21995, partial [Clostridioides difficile]